MNEVFNFEGANIRTVIVDDEPMFVGNDVANVLGFKNTSDALKRHVDEEDKQLLKSGNTTLENVPNRGLIAINESGVYALVFGSELASAKKFQKWVTSEVLPSIRKTGSYVVAQMTPEQQIKLIATGNTRLNERVDGVETKVDDLAERFGLTASAAKRLEKIRKKQVVYLLGGYDSNAYKQLSSKVFAEIGSDFKERFDLPRYDSLPMNRFDEAADYLSTWQLPNNSMLMVRELNSQTELKV